ncbi:unnamed protein product, partial [Effrenium voratum]
SNSPRHLPLRSPSSAMTKQLRGSAFSACAVLAAFTVAGWAFVSPRVSMRQPQLNRELVQRQFFGNKPAQPAVEEETVGDKIKAFWADERTQKFIAFGGLASTALDMLGLLGGEAGVGASLSEAFATFDAGAALSEGSSTAEALADAAQSADFSSASESIGEFGAN